MGNEVVAPAAGDPVYAFVDLGKKESWILSDDNGDTMRIKHTVDPEFSEDNTTARIVGKIILEKEEEMPKKLLFLLIDHLETKVIDGEPVTITNIPFTLMDEGPKEVTLADNYYGEIKQLNELTDEMAVIARVGTSTAAFLSSNETNLMNRRAFVFVNEDEAKKALQAFKIYPPFSKNPFFAKATVLELKVISRENLDKEEFIYFPLWQRACANLSYHMTQKSKTGGK